MIKLLTSVMVCEQDSADLGLHPDSDKHEFNKPRQFNISQPQFLH